MKIGLERNMPCATGMGGYDSHVVMATITNGICTSEIPPMETLGVANENHISLLPEPVL